MVAGHIGGHGGRCPRGSTSNGWTCGQSPRVPSRNRRNCGLETKLAAPWFCSFSISCSALLRFLYYLGLLPGSVLSLDLFLLLSELLCSPLNSPTFLSAFPLFTSSPYVLSLSVAVSLLLLSPSSSFRSRLRRVFAKSPAPASRFSRHSVSHSRSLALVETITSTVKLSTCLSILLHLRLSQVSRISPNTPAFLSINLSEPNT
ncbi:hypothetical protein BD779DRAFT_113391 [Infundibulicybe gibba]|nr:hypothetical protein BD779DRAFT_113391 [Infundibulicybe gibba]